MFLKNLRLSILETEPILKDEHLGAGPQGQSQIFQKYGENILKNRKNNNFWSRFFIKSSHNPQELIRTSYGMLLTSYGVLLTSRNRIVRNWIYGNVFWRVSHLELWEPPQHLHFQIMCLGGLRNHPGQSGDLCVGLFPEIEPDMYVPFDSYL